MNQTPATARDKSTAIESGSPFSNSVPENTKRKGITNSGHPKAMATQPVRLGWAPARFDATKAAIATGGEIIDRHPEYMRHTGAAIGARPIVTRGGAHRR